MLPMCHRRRLKVVFRQHSVTFRIVVDGGRDRSIGARPRRCLLRTQGRQLKNCPLFGIMSFRFCWSNTRICHISKVNQCRVALGSNLMLNIQAAAKVSHSSYSHPIAAGTSSPSRISVRDQVLARVVRGEAELSLCLPCKFTSRLLRPPQLPL